MIDSFIVDEILVLPNEEFSILFSYNPAGENADAIVATRHDRLAIFGEPFTTILLFAEPKEFELLGFSELCVPPLEDGSGIFVGITGCVSSVCGSDALLGFLHHE